MCGIRCTPRHRGKQTNLWQKKIPKHFLICFHVRSQCWCKNLVLQKFMHKTRFLKNQKCPFFALTETWVLVIFATLHFSTSKIRAKISAKIIFRNKHVPEPSLKKFEWKTTIFQFFRIFYVKFVYFGSKNRRPKKNPCKTFITDYIKPWY